ncbi:hypothetical protein [Haloferula sargassicola]|uniref:Lipocalin-like domain-containing protein n=1 Tax=Haloferula sargassicola TaxID=490096 RepID=A0ABP9URP5_9BACT
MITVTQIRGGADYMGRHLSMNDYYSEHERVVGYWQGCNIEPNSAVVNAKTPTCFDVEMGTPTLTVELPGKQQMLPWSSFLGCDWEGDCIRLRFTGWELVLHGRELRELWRELQLHDVRVVRTLREVEEGEFLLKTLESVECPPAKPDGE